MYKQNVNFGNVVEAHLTPSSCVLVVDSLFAVLRPVGLCSKTF